MYDVIVLGLGGAGSAAAWHLARRGLRVLGLERFGPAHDRGSSHGGSRIVRQAYFEHPDYVPLLRRSFQLWDELAAAADEPLLRRTGIVVAGAPDSAVVAGTLHSARIWDLPHQVLDTSTLRQRFPTFTPAPDEIAVYEADAGWVPPERTVAAQLRLATRAGAALRFHTTVTGWHAGADGVRVSAGDQEWHADRLVVAPGAWAADLLPDLQVPLQVTRQVQHWFAPADPAAFVDHPVFLWQLPDGTQFYGFPRTGPASEGVKVAIHRQGRPAHPDRLDRTVAAGRGDPDPGTARRPGAGARRYPPGCPGLHVHQHSRRALPARPVPDQRPGGARRRLLRARLQVRPGARRAHRGPGHRGRSRTADRPVRPRPVRPRRAGTGDCYRGQATVTGCATTASNR